MRYEAYKRVDLPWVAEIPEHWEVCRNKNIFKAQKELIGDKSNSTPLLSLSTKGIRIRGKEEIGGKAPETYDTYQVVKEDDLILCLFDLDVSAVFSDVSKYSGMISPAYDSFKIYNGVPNFYKYVFDKIFQERSYKVHSKSVRYTITTDNFQSLNMIAPPKEEQEKIANFLDWKVNEIDRLINKEKEFQSETIKLFSTIVSKKIGALKCDKVKLKQIFDFGKGLSITKDNLGETGIKCISYGEIHNKQHFSFKSTDMSLKGLSKTDGVNIGKFAMLNKGDFVFADTSEDIQGCGNFTHLEDDKNQVYAGYHTVVAKPKTEINPTFISFCFESDYWRDQIRSEVKGVKVYSITQFMLKNTVIPFPQTDVQEEIANDLSISRSNFEMLMGYSKEKISILKSLKKSLISEVVTGKINIQDIEIPEYDPVEMEINEDLENTDVNTEEGEEEWD